MLSYKHIYTTRLSILSTILLFLVHFFELISKNCPESSAINFVFTFLMSLLEFPKIFKSCSTNCHKLHDQLDNKKIYLFKFVLYLSIAIGTLFLYKAFPGCWATILHGVIMIFPALGYLISFYIKQKESSNNTDNNISKSISTRFSNFGSNQV